MNDFSPLFAGLQVLAALFGAVMAVWAEFLYLRKAGASPVEAERAHMRSVGRGLSIGMTVFLLASVGLIWSAYTTGGAEPALSSVYWIEMVLVVVLITITWALSRGRISFGLGSASIFSAWWFLTFYVLGRITGITFGGALILYVIATVIFFWLLSYLRMFVRKPAESAT